MNLDYVMILSVIFNAAQEGHCAKTNLRAVTHFPVVDEYYFSLLTQNVVPLALSDSSSSSSSSSVAAAAPTAQTDDEIVKKKLCRKIFTTVHFERKEREWVDIDDPTTLRDSFWKNPSLFSHILPPSSEPSGASEYINPLRPYSFLYDLVKKTDLMFVCPILKRSTDEIQPYFVTREYNVNLVPDGAPIAGRFVFRREGANEIAIEALAEEAAVSSTGIKHKFRLVAEHKYMKLRQFDPRRGDLQAEDPVCGLTPSNKLRLCASIFASKVLRFRYKFTPSLENVVPQDCRKIRVSFFARRHVRMLTKISSSLVGKVPVYAERMIGCRARRTVGTAEDLPVIYYVSRGYAKNTVFTFKEKYEDGRIFVKHYMRNVSVVDGLSAEEIGQQTDAS